jgi:hypothetical protein
MSNALISLLFRGILAVLVAAFICALGMAFGEVLIFGPRPSGALAGLFNMFIVAMLASIPFIAIGTVVIGIPADWLLRHSKVRNPLAYAGSGAAGGLLATIPLALLAGSDLGPLPLIFAAYGLVAASSYWYFVPRLSARDG